MFLNKIFVKFKVLIIAISVFVKLAISEFTDTVGGCVVNIIEHLVFIEHSQI